MPNQKTQLPIFDDLAKVKGVTRDGKVHAIPFCFDSIGLIYDTDKVKTPPTSMDVLWDPQYKGKVLAYDNRRAQLLLHGAHPGQAIRSILTAEQMDDDQEEAGRPQGQRAELLHHRR